MIWVIQIHMMKILIHSFNCFLFLKIRIEKKIELYIINKYYIYKLTVFCIESVIWNI